MLVICGALGYHLYFAIQELTPCTEPLPYTINNFDTKFNISREYFLSALTEAEAIWEKSYGKELFNYDPLSTDGDLVKVNLIYDYRQEATSKLKSLGVVVENNQASYNNLELKYKTLNESYRREENAYGSRVATFNQAIENYEKDVAFWNKKGGAPQKEYQELEARRVALDQEMRSIQKEEARLEAMVDEINALVVALNRLADTLNLTVDKYNTTNEARGESFEEGVYITDGENAQIDIYEFSSRKKLVRVLAHELGHALGMDHVPDADSIMYEFNEGDSMTLSADDLAELAVVCKI